MIALEQTRSHVESLGLTTAVDVLESGLDSAARKQLPYPEMLADLLDIEVAARRERYLTTQTRMAHLPFQRSLEQFDFSFQPSIDEREVKELATPAFVTEASPPRRTVSGTSRCGQSATADWLWPWPSGRLRTATEPTSSVPMT